MKPLNFDELNNIKISLDKWQNSILQKLITSETEIGLYFWKEFKGIWIYISLNSQCPMT